MRVRSRLFCGLAGIAAGCSLLAPAVGHAEPTAVSQRVEMSASSFPNGTLFFDLRSFLLVDGTTGPIRQLQVGAQAAGLPVSPQAAGGCIQITIPNGTNAGDIQGSGTIRIPFTVVGVSSSSSAELTVTSGPANQAPGTSCTSQLPENAAPQATGGTQIELTGSTTIPLGSLVSDPDQDPLSFTVVQAPAGTLSSTSGPVEDLQYTAPAPNAEGAIEDIFTIEVTDNNVHPFEQPLLLTFTLGLSQDWQADPGAAAVTAPGGCTASASGVTCEVRPGARQVTINMASVVAPTVANTSFSYSVTLEGPSGSENLGTVSPASGQFTKSPDGTTTGQAVVTYDYPEDATTPINLRYTIVSGGFTEQGVVTVAFNPTQTLGAMAMNPNQRAVANRIDYICPELGRQQETLSEGELQLLRQCGNLTNSQVTSASEIPAAMESIADEEIAAQQRTATDLARDMNKVLAARTAALRGGASGISVSGLNLGIDGQSAVASAVEPWLNKVLGGGASSDQDSPFARLGVFIQGQLNTGDKDESVLESGFDFDTVGGMIGVDYRFRNDLVLGLAGSYYESDVDFDADSATLDASSLGLSLYGSYYPTDAFYLDLFAGASRSDYDQARTVGYTFISGTQYSTRLLGSSEGAQGFAGINGGYEFVFGGFSITPSVKTYYLDGSIDAYSERARDASASSCAPDCNAWDIEIGEQDVKSFTASGGLQLAYVWNGKWGVFRPYLRADFVREFEDAGQVVIARLLNDNQATGAIGSQTAPITITTDNPDRDYVLVGVGASVQLIHGLAGFFDYQRLEGYEGLTSAAYSLGLRYEIQF